MAPFNAIRDLIFVDNSGASSEPVTLQQVKDWLRIDVADDDGILTDLITVARILCEEYSCISFIQRQVIAIVNNTLGGIYLPYGPVAEIVELQKENGDVITTDNYKVAGVQFKQLMHPCDCYIRVKYNAGYTTLPHSLRKAVLQAVSYLYAHHGDEEAGQFSPMAEATLKPIRRVW